MKVAITGITGFVGQNLSKYLSDFSILGISRKKTEQCITYEELSAEKLNKFNAFVHLAGKAHDLKKTSQDQEYFEVNTELTKNIFAEFLKSNCETFVYMSSVKAAADEVEGVLTEEHIPEPITVYGKSKLAAEQYLLAQEIPSNKRVYILRPCMIHGPYNKGNLNLLYNFVSKGIPYPFGKYQNERSFVSVENLCFVIKELIENKNIASGIYNIADDTTLSTRELVEIIGGVVGMPAKVLYLSKFLVRSIATLGDVLPLPINSERVHKLTENYCVSNKKIKQAIGKEFPLTTKEGLIQTFRSFVEKKGMKSPLV